MPLTGELTTSLIGRAAARYGLEAAGVLRLWACRNSPARHEGGGVRADAEVVLNEAGRHALAELCRVEPKVLARALPAFRVDDVAIGTGWDADQAQAWWRAAAVVAGPAAFACRLCTARRTGQAVRAVRYVPRWQRVCIRHERWLMDADADQPLEHLDLHALPEVAAAQRRWPGVARRAVRAGAEPARVFALAHAVVARWWDKALHWERETIWPQRLHQVAVGNAGTDLQRWRVVGRDAVIFPEVVAVADALLDPAMAELVWKDSGAGQPRTLSAGGMFCRRLGERVGRNWLGPLAATDYGGPLIAWMGAVIRRRRGTSAPPAYGNGPWWLRQEHQPATMATQLRMLGKEKETPGATRMWRAAVSAEQRALISRAVENAEEQLLQLHGAQSGPVADVARRLLRGLGHSAGLIENAWKRTALAAVNGGVPLEEVARWVDMPVEVLREMLTASGREDSG
ncbi:DNA-binding protein [Streptomyces sp. NPDC059717]|uniref:DNA-binding protein n=1 Tax=Streptomyces sp. NPDC059717 TaxID=3346922 RepID=UPI0036A24253